MYELAFLSGVLVGGVATYNISKLLWVATMAKAVELGLVTLHTDKLEELKKEE